MIEGSQSGVQMVYKAEQLSIHGPKAACCLKGLKKPGHPPARFLFVRINGL